MKFTKKISLFVALALVITIGGVYAAWLYPADDAAVGSATKTFTGNMTQVDTQATSKGNISVDTATDTLKVFVDDAGDYLAEAIAQGSFFVSFTPVDGVSDDIANNGIEMVLDLEIAGNKDKVTDDEGHEVEIFTVKTSSIDLGKGEKQDNGSFKVEVTGAQILDCLNFCVDSDDTVHSVTLDTLAENQAFGTALNTYIIKLTISEKPAA